MNKQNSLIKNIVVMVITLSVCIAISMLIQSKFKDESLSATIFLLGTFIVAVVTDGYFFGIISALISVLIINYAFTFPYYGFDFQLVENSISVIILLIITISTCAITTRLKANELAKAEAEKERMRANLLRAISHDLRTPLTTIYGSSSAMLDNNESFTKEQKIQMLRGIMEDSLWLNRIVENLLSVTRLDSKNSKIIKTNIVLDELVDSILVKFAKRFPNQEVNVSIPEEFVVIPMDAILIEQVAINILENAVMHAKGMTKLSFKVSIVGDKAIFEIEDDGCGVDKDKLKNIFNGYTSTEDIPSDGKKINSGIGLSVCATIIKVHGGEIQAINKKEGGMLFRFSLYLDSENDTLI